MPSMVYIEKAAHQWEREGILTLESAEEYLKALDARKSIRGEIKNVMQIRNREFSETEKRYVDGWINMGFKADAIAIAYDRTLVKTGNLSWSYMDTIIKNWHGKNLQTPQEILGKDSRQPASNAYRGTKPPSDKFGSPDQQELDRMQRLLNKIKET